MATPDSPQNTLCAVCIHTFSEAGERRGIVCGSITPSEIHPPTHEPMHSPGAKQHANMPTQSMPSTTTTTTTNHPQPRTLLTL